MKERIVGYFGEGKLFERYGTTETSIATALRPEDQLRKQACVGQPFSADAGPPARRRRARKSAPARSASSAVCSPYLFSGYLNLPEATAKAMRGDWFATGDLAREDEEGYVYLVDRKNDMIISGGENVYPREVEEVLLVASRGGGVRGDGFAASLLGRGGRRLSSCCARDERSERRADGGVPERLSRYKVPKETGLCSCRATHGQARSPGTAHLGRQGNIRGQVETVDRNRSCHRGRKHMFRLSRLLPIATVAILSFGAIAPTFAADKNTVTVSQASDVLTLDPMLDTSPISAEPRR